MGAVATFRHMAKKQEPPKKAKKRQTVVRIDADLLEELEADADDNSRSVNMQIVWLIKNRVRELREKREQEERRARTQLE